FDPNRDECFSAATGVGAFLNGRPIRPSRTTDLEHSLYATSFPTNVQRNDPDVRCFMDVVDRTLSIRRTGSAALNLAYVACGRFDVASAYRTKLWDFAAGTVLVRESGGVITTWTGEPIPLTDSPHLATSTPELAATLLGRTRSIGG
ncbi:MAG: inositol monophosphatase, partial [Planctomycetia bacterium]|nr:inositol monophosphatase [Planctomycetia bacterium]